MSAVAAAGAGAAEAEQAEEKTEFDVVLTEVGSNKIAVSAPQSLKQLISKSGAKRPA